MLFFRRLLIRLRVYISEDAADQDRRGKRKRISLEFSLSLSFYLAGTYELHTREFDCIDMRCKQPVKPQIHTTHTH